MEKTEHPLRRPKVPIENEAHRDIVKKVLGAGLCRHEVRQNKLDRPFQVFTFGGYRLSGGNLSAPHRYSVDDRRWNNLADLMAWNSFASLVYEKNWVSGVVPCTVAACLNNARLIKPDLEAVAAPSLQPLNSSII